MRRVALILSTVAAVWLALAPVALASHGIGLIKDANDKVVTDAGFLLILAFPLLVGFLSYVQSRLEKRKAARKAAQRARLASPEWRGGW